MNIYNTCNTCNQSLPMQCFTLRQGRPLSSCKQCTKQRAADNRIEREFMYLSNGELPQKMKRLKKHSPNTHLERSYGITLEEKVSMLDSQKGYCAICGTQLDRSQPSTFVVDHCHTTGNLRGILCNPCNLLLGHARDNQQILLNAIQYLKSNSDEAVPIV